MKSSADLLQLLSDHVGSENGLPAKTLGVILGITERQVRELVSALRLEGVAVAVLRKPVTTSPPTPPSSTRPASFCATARCRAFSSNLGCAKFPCRICSANYTSQPDFANLRKLAN